MTDFKAQAEEIADWMAGEAGRWDQEGRINPVARQRIQEKDIGALRVPRTFGGPGGHIPDLVAVMIILARGDACVARAVIAHFVAVERLLLLPPGSARTASLAGVAAGAWLGAAPTDDVTHAGEGAVISEVLHAAIEIGIARAALADATRWVREGVRPVKESGVARAADDPFILHALGRVQAHVQGAEALVWSVVAALEAVCPAGETRAEDARDVAGVAAAASVRALAEAGLAAAQAWVVSADAALLAGQAIFDVGGASTTLRKHHFDRHWRNARAHTVRDPLAHHYRTIGEHHLYGPASLEARGY